MDIPYTFQQLQAPQRNNYRSRRCLQLEPKNSRAGQRAPKLGRYLIKTVLEFCQSTSAITNRYYLVAVNMTVAKTTIVLWFQFQFFLEISLCMIAESYLVTQLSEWLSLTPKRHQSSRVHGAYIRIYTVSTKYSIAYSQAWAMGRDTIIKLQRIEDLHLCFQYSIVQGSAKLWYSY